MFFYFYYLSSISISEFEDIVNERFKDESQLVDGYAPFCKHVFLQNDFTDAKTCVLPITNENESLLRTKYEARNDKEVRCFPKYSSTFLFLCLFK